MRLGLHLFINKHTSQKDNYLLQVLHRWEDKWQVRRGDSKVVGGLVRTRANSQNPAPLPKAPCMQELRCQLQKLQVQHQSNVCEKEKLLEAQHHLQDKLRCHETELHHLRGMVDCLREKNDKVKGGLGQEHIPDQIFCEGDNRVGLVEVLWRNC